MYHSFSTFNITPVGVALLTVEIDIQKRGIPSFDIIGLPAPKGNAAKERIKHAILNAGFKFPPYKVIVYVTNSDLAAIEHADLQIALAILCLYLNIPLPRELPFFGKLDLQGNVKECYLGTSFLEFALRTSSAFFCSGEKEIVTHPKYANITGFHISNLNQAVSCINNGTAVLKKIKTIYLNRPNFLPQKSIRGNLRAKRCIEIAAAGRHHLFISGPPGVGKTLLANAMPYLIPVSSEDYLNMYLKASYFGDYSTLTDHFPFIAPNINISTSKLFGSKSSYESSAAYMSHKGVLFMDEFTYFSSTHLESLKKLLDERTMYEEPCDFILVAAANPCPCGYYGSIAKECKCTPQTLKRYRQKTSAGLLERFELFTYIDIQDTDIVETAPGDVWYEFTRKSVQNAVDFASTLPNECTTLPTLTVQLKKLVKNIPLSPRLQQNTLKVARTIANLDQSLEITQAHLLEALEYRPAF